MQTTQRSSEKGQALVLIVLAMIVLLGFTALAVDGSMIYADRRYAQNGSDASSLAGGGAAAHALGFVVTSANWSTSGTEADPSECRDGNAAPAAQRAKEAAVARAADNDFSITPVIYETQFDAAESAVWTECSEEFFPLFNFHRKFMDVYVKITHDTPTSFAHFVFKSLTRNTTKAVTRIIPAEPYGFGQAIIALNPSDHCPPGGNDGAGFSGGPNILVDGGGILSNGCVNGNSSALTVTVQGGANVIYGEGLNANPTSWNFPDGGGFEPLPDDGKLPLSQFNPPVPDCTGNEYHADDLIDQTTLEGLYCIYPGENLDLTCNGPHCDEMAGTDLTIVMRGGKFTMNDGVIVNLLAPPAGYIGEAMPGILLFLPIQYYGSLDGTGCGNTNQEVKINGNSSSFIQGTILAPCSDVSLEGGSDTYILNSQVIGWNVDVAGNNSASVVYDDSLNGLNPGNLNLYR